MDRLGAEPGRLPVIIQKWNFTVGRNWFAEMDNASRIAERTVAVLSEAYGDSDYCRLEWQQAMELDPRWQQAQAGADPDRPL